MGSGSRSLSTALFIAWRYFFSRKSTQAIHVIAIVAVTAIAIVTMVMVVALSVFNGFERFTTDQFATLCPTTEIRSDAGQDYSASAVTLPPGVTAAPVLTTQALAKCGDNAMPVTLIGIDSTYQRSGEDGGEAHAHLVEDDPGKDQEKAEDVDEKLAPRIGAED